MGIIFVLIVIAIAVIVPISIAQQQRTNAAWTEAGRQLGLRSTPGGFLQKRELVGSVDGFRIKVDVYSDDSGDSRSNYTRYRIRFPHSLGLGLRLSREGFLSGIGKMLGAQDIHVGDAQFDSAVTVKGRDPQRVREFLTPARRSHITRFLGLHPRAQVEDGELNWRDSGVCRDAGQLVRNVRRALELARELAAGGSQPEPLDEPAPLATAADIPWQRWGKPPEPIRPAMPNIRHEPEPVVLEVVEPTESELTEPELIEPEPADAEPSHATVVADVEPVEQSPTEGVSKAPAGVFDVAALCEDVFGRRSSTEASRTFDEQYRGQEVHWSGVLRRADRFTFDPVFGTEPGAKAVIDVHELSAAHYGSRTVTAIVQLPRSDLETLRERTGQTVAFAGQLKKSDVLLRNIYVADGRLTAPI